MSTVNFWNSFVPSEVQESRFGLIPTGEHIVTILDVMPIRAGQNFKLDNDGKITGLVAKDATKFDFQFDQDVLAIVYKDSEGRVLIDRRSSVGWLTNDEATATPELIQRWGLVSVGKRFTKKGLGVPSKRDADQKPEDTSIGGKTKSCIDMANRLFQACGTSGIDELVGKKLKIVVVERKNGAKSSNEVKGYYAPDAVIKTKADAPVATPKAKIEEPADDDLPF